MTCNQNCNQGRRCNCCLKERDLFWDVMEGFVTLAFIVGVIASVCFMFGYYWYTP